MHEALHQRTMLVCVKEPKARRIIQGALAGTWDAVKRRCVGGTIENDPPMSGSIKVEVCVDGCN